MTDKQEVMNLIKQYLENSVAPNGFWDNVVDYILPMFSMLVVIIGGVWTIYTYIKGKNREIDEKVLKEVYAPMFQFFVKNDSLGNLKEVDTDYEKEPIRQWASITTEYKKSKAGIRLITRCNPILNLSKSDFLDMFNEINMGVAPQELVALFSIYRATDYIAQNIEVSEEKKRAKAYEVEIEYAIRQHAYEGYMKYCRKLGISRIKKNDLFEIKRDCIRLKLRKLDEFKLDELKTERKHITAVFGQSNKKKKKK